ncbi:MAG: hypothetical protein HC930_04085 [Hydrococcus sp. SU_1_0]|nr:hypothetical protein [Hydrococcus sp. SU_1_0]
MLEEISEDIVIFIDEVDGLLDLNLFPQTMTFPKIFLDTISYCYTNRNRHPRNPSKFNRLTFALFGKTSVLENNSFLSRNDFRIELNSFKIDDFEEERNRDMLKRLSGVEQLSEKFEKWREVIQEVLYWTNGQPLLTNNLLSLFSVLIVL